jgi:hypothetical protein
MPLRLKNDRREIKTSKPSKNRSAEQVRSALYLHFIADL